MEFEIKECTIRMINRTDAERFFQLIDTNRNRLEDFFAGTLVKTKNVEATKEYCLKIEQLIADKFYFPFLLFDKNNGRAIGLIDFKNIDWNVPKVEIGAFIDSDYEGKGIVSKAGSKLINELVKQYKFKKVYCRAAAENTKSVSTILRYGFELEGTVRRDYKTTSGKLVDLNYYGKLFF